MAKSLMNEKGYTLLEMLLAFMIFLMLSSFFPMILKLVAADVKEMDRYDMEVDLFFVQLAMEVRESQHLYSTGTKLSLQMPSGSLVTYERYGKVVRRRVDGQGHEVVLQNVKSIQYMPATNGTVIQIESEDGRSYVKRLSGIQQPSVEVGF